MVIVFEAVTNKDKWRGLILRLLTVLIILLLVVFSVEKMTDKFWGVKRKSISETPGKRIDRWGRAIIIFIFVVSSITKGSSVILEWQFVLFFMALMGFQVILEWKYLKKSKQYISSLISSMIICPIILLVIHFYS
ncbi:hypothetical protein CYL18_17175 [Pradoshia eiseniae]|uniref:DUF4181 domain-containing protein n=1 Tax=Pradoshia eiseniae TaxID=2064768 RepID=A0A2S7MVW1_9BACI|nr:hypothetical protein CYL18_17175 [Pradoshia eiseniae]